MDGCSSGGDRLEVVAVVGGSCCRQGGGDGAGRGRPKATQNRANRGGKAEQPAAMGTGGDGDVGRRLD